MTMARLASQSKAGYYPIPVEEIERIIPHLRINYVPGEQEYINALDPCCGEGEALQIFSNAMKPVDAIRFTSYGVELEQTRFEKAAAVLDHTIHEDYALLRANDAYSMMGLNPPYDENYKERSELRFLRTLSGKAKNVLCKNGLLMFCIPQAVLAPCAIHLTKTFKDIRVFRFTDDFFDQFEQVVVFGSHGSSPLTEQRKQAKHLRAQKSIRKKF